MEAADVKQPNTRQLEISLLEKLLAESALGIAIPKSFTANKWHGREVGMNYCPAFAHEA